MSNLTEAVEQTGSNFKSKPVGGWLKRLAEVLPKIDPTRSALPGVAQVAMQEGHDVGKLIANRENGRLAPPPFRYVDKGTMAVIGRGYAVPDSRITKMSGLPTWLA